MHTPAAEEDIHNIYSEVIGLSGRWSDMCLALRLPPSDQSEISTAYLGNPEECLQAVLVKWLKKGYNYQKFGSPTWRMLVEAVADPAGGNDSALANFLTQKHQGMHSKSPILKCIFKDRFPFSINEVVLT